MAARNQIMTQHPYLERVRRFVENRLGQKMTLERVAGVAGLEETYFSAYFHTTVGLTYSQWLSGLRVISAVDFMAAGASMEVAARKSGFGHLRTLQRSFKRRLGLPPRVYKSGV
jgi:transcriptional regulator GlxA family with amidase domain